MILLGNLGRSALYALYIVPCAFTCWQNKNSLIMMHFARHCVCHTHIYIYIYILYMCIYSYSESRERLRCICDGATSVHLPVLASGIIIDISSYTSIYLYLYISSSIYCTFIYIYNRFYFEHFSFVFLSLFATVAGRRRRPDGLPSWALRIS